MTDHDRKIREAALREAAALCADAVDEERQMLQGIRDQNSSGWGMACRALDRARWLRDEILALIDREPEEKP